MVEGLLTLSQLNMTVIVIICFISRSNQLSGMKCMFEHQHWQCLPKLNKYVYSQEAYARKRAHICKL